uniref:Uncharacterized protein n=1 Tax=Rhizophora mucronata TaxID=61149 RepID=A0A2P2JTU1_RHIMU
MGNRFICLTKKDARENTGSKSKRMGRSQRKMLTEEENLHRQALSMALQQQLSQRFDGSMSRRIGSTSSRRRNLPPSLTNGKQVCSLHLGRLILGSSSLLLRFHCYIYFITLCVK